MSPLSNDQHQTSISLVANSSKPWRASYEPQVSIWVEIIIVRYNGYQGIFLQTLEKLPGTKQKIYVSLDKC